MGKMAGDVLADASKLIIFPLLVSSGGDVEQNIEVVASLCHEKELKVGHLHFMKSLI